MLKSISISALMLLSSLSVFAQDNGATPTLVTTPGATPSSTPSNSSIDQTSPSTTTVPAPVDTTSPAATSTDMTTPATSTTPVVTPTTPVTTTTPDAASSSTTVTTTAIVTPSKNFTCVGSNPNWNLTISQDLITYGNDKDKAMKLKAVTPLTPVGDSSGNLQVFVTKSPENKNVMILVNKNSSGCTNASGQNYQYEAFIVFPNKVVTGCCNPS